MYYRDRMVRELFKGDLRKAARYCGCSLRDSHIYELGRIYYETKNALYRKFETVELRDQWL